MRYWPQIRLLLLVLLFLGLVAYVLGFRLGVNARSGIDALGGTWVAEGAEWQETDGQFRAQIMYVPERVNLERGQTADIVMSLCEGTLANLAHAGHADLTPGEVYRLDLNFKTSIDAVALPINLPVPVVEGACRFDIWPDFALFPTYAGSLSGWFLNNSGFENAGDLGVIPAFQFRPRPDAEVNVRTFDFLAACNAVLSDDLAWALIEQSPSEVSALTIMAQGTGAIGFYRKVGMRVSDGQCTAVDQQ